MTSAKLKIIGMHCANCVNTIEKGLGKQEGVESAVVNLALENAQVKYDEKKVSQDQIIKKIQDLGYDAKVFSLEEDTGAKSNALRNKFILSFIFTLPVVVFAMLEMFFGITVPYYIYISFLLATPVQFYVGWDFYVGAYKALRNKSANMDVLIAMGTTAAYAYSIYTMLTGSMISYFETSAALITFVILGKFLEERAKAKTSEAIKKLVDLSPKTAIVSRAGKEIEIPVDQVVKDDIVLVKPGSKVPVDGLVIDGSSSIDESMITGESIPIEKNKGSRVIGGTINKNGSLRVKAEKIGSETVLSHIIRLIEDAQTKKAPIQRFADVISAYFVPLVIAIALIAFGIWYFGLGATFPFALTIAVSILVIACPCALGLATPTSIMVGIGMGAKKGILIKGGDSLEKIHKARHIIFDKTGTLTFGKPELTDIVSFSKMSEKEILSITYSLEKNSEHPLADAIVSYAKEQKASEKRITAFSAITGYGIRGKIAGKQYYFGNTRLLAKNKINITKDYLKRIEDLEGEGKTVMILSTDKALLGIIGVADKIKPTSKKTIAELKKLGITTHMITGDNKRTAAAIARQLGIENYYAEVLPKDKLEYVKKIQERGVTIMVGDGVNDAPALAQADIGIAMGSGTDVAIETGSVVLMRNDLLDIISTIKLSRYTIAKIKQNMFWALVYNVAGIPIAAGVLLFAFGYLLSPIIAGAAMALSSVSVVLNSLTLKYKTI